MIKIEIISVGKKVPAWIADGYQEYFKRLPRELKLRLVEVAPARRGKNCSTAKAMGQEAEAILKNISADHRLISLDERGKKQTTLALSKKLKCWIDSGQQISFIIGGADGLDKNLIKSADESWSLSDYTLPHALVRVVLIEQIYRAWCILNKHPYHRE